MEKRVVRFEVQPPEGYDNEVGRAIWALEDARSRTLGMIEGLSHEALDAVPPSGVNTIVTLLYHVAKAEASWIYERYLQEPYPDHIEALFPYKDHSNEGTLAVARGETLETHLHRLRTVRESVREIFRHISTEEFRRIRRLEGPNVLLEATAGSILNHLGQHDAEHRGEISMIVESLWRAQTPGR